jgi:predicted Zn-dependent peptidase
MRRVILNNGLTVLYKKKKGNSVTVEVMVNVGSINEEKSQKGISHMIEHLVFEGTKKRPTGRKIANSIEKLGGEFNAYTTPNRTNYYIKVLNKDFVIAADVLSDVIFNPLLEKKSFLKERKVVIKEIDLLYDDPRYYQWVLLQGTLFSQHPVRFPVYGSKKNVMNLSIDEINEYYEKYYLPKNMVISIVGNVNNWKKTIKKTFGQIKKNKIKIKNKKFKQVKLKRNVIKKEKRSIANTHLVLGYKTKPRNHKDSYVLDVIDGVLGRGQSGRIFTELREKRGLAYEVSSYHVSDKDYGYFALYAIIDKKNVGLVKKLMKKELNKLLKLDEIDLVEAKKFVEGNYLLNLESSQQLADQVLFWESMGNYKLLKEYITKIREISVSDVKRVIKKYFDKGATIIIEGK